VATKKDFSYIGLGSSQNCLIKNKIINMSQEKTTYELIGGAEKLRELVDRFYDLMDLEENYQGIRLMHPADSTSSREKLFMFLSGWMGGPDLFVEQYGHPRLKARHLPFSIGISERDQWLQCMRQAMKDVGINGILFERLMQSFFTTADWMRNRVG
jgi:hemoglobin